MIKLKYKPITKKELCNVLDVSSFTLAFWLNKRYFKELQKLGYEKKQKIIMPEQLKFLANKLIFEVE